MDIKPLLNGKNIILFLALAVILLTHILLPPAGMSKAGFQVLGVLLAAILLFISWGTGWTSMFIVCALMFIPELSAAQVTRATFGNNTAVFLLFCFMLSACLTKTGTANRVAIWFLTNRLSRKSPWWTLAMYLAAAYVLDLFLSAAVCIMILIPILGELFDSIGLDKTAKTPLATAMLLGSVVAAQLANGANPISHAVTLQGFSMYESYSGEAMDLLIYCAVCTPITILVCALFFLVVKYLWRPDIRALSGIDYDALRAACGPMGRRERIAVLGYLLCVALWLLPGLSSYFLPTAAPMLSKINNCMPPLLILFLLNFIKIEGEPVLSWEDAVHAINWPTYLFIATIMGLGTFIGSAEIGLSAWLANALEPVFGGVGVWAFVLIMVLLVNVLTNFCSNSVAQAVGFAIAMPLSLSVYSGQIAPMAVAILVTNAALNGWATSPATPTAAVAYATGWGDNRTILIWGLVMTGITTAVYVALGLPLAGFLCR